MFASLATDGTDGPPFVLLVLESFPVDLLQDIHTDDHAGTKSIRTTLRTMKEKFSLIYKQGVIDNSPNAIYSTG